MRCTNCGLDNRPERRFCGGCGKSLAAVCADCGFENEPGERFCGGCGRAITGTTTDAAGGRTRGELREVMVLFADLAGYTRLSSELDPEQVHSLLARLFDALDGVVHEHGGSVDKHIGDNVMALFGAPVAHENDAERAVRAALAMHQKVQELGATLNVPLELHVGIAGGQVMASPLGSRHHNAYTVVGSSVNLAARLQGAAQGGETLVDAGIYRAVASLVEARAVPDLVLKGIDRPIVAYRVLGPASGARHADHAFVGRERELQALAVDLERSSERGCVVALRGDAGMGKSRLARELLARARARGLACLETAFAEHGLYQGSSALGRLVRALLVELAGEEDVERAAGEYVGAEHVACLCDLAEVAVPDALRPAHHAMDNAARALAKGAALGELFAKAASRAPRLLLIEDLHWATGEERSLLAALAVAVLRARGLLLLTGRAEALDAARAEALGARLLDMGPLSRADAERLAAEFQAPAELAALAVERAAGNPLFLEQLVASANEAGGERHVPGSIRGLIQARVDRLAAADRVAVQAACVLGTSLELESLRALLGDQSYEPTELVRRALLEPRANRLEFCHGLVREGVYSTLTRAHRRALHLAAAELAGADPMARAHHLGGAEDARAAGAYLEAAHSSSAALHFEQACELVARGLALAEPHARYPLELEQGRLLRLLGRPQPAAEAFERALGLARSPEERCRAALGLAGANRVGSRYDAALGALVVAEAAADERAELGVELAELHYLRASVLFALSRPEESRRAALQARELAERAGSFEWQGRALSALGDVEYALGDLASSSEAFARCLTLAEEHALPRLALFNRGMHAQARLWSGQAVAAEREAERAIVEARALRDRYAEMFARHTLGAVLAERGKLEQAREQDYAALELSREIGSQRFEHEILAQIAELEWLLGDAELALGRARAALALGRAVGLEFCGPMVFGALALAATDADERRQALAEGEELLSRGSMFFNRLFFYRNAIEAALAARRPDEVRRYADALERCLADGACVPAVLYAERARCLASLLEPGASSGVAERLEALAGRARELGLELERGPRSRVRSA